MLVEDKKLLQKRDLAYRPSAAPLWILVHMALDERRHYDRSRR